MRLLQLNHRCWPKLKPELWLLALAVLALPGCFGGTVAQQLARSIFMQGADKASAAAMDAHELNQKTAARYMVPNNTKLDDYQIAFLRSGFEPIQAHIEQLPQAAPQNEPNPKLLQENKLVNVEVWNLLIGDEKQILLEKASLQGSELIPPREEWPRWHVAVGAVEDNKTSSHREPITFLIPPNIGKMHAGAKALVELPDNGGLSVARYTSH